MINYTTYPVRDKQKDNANFGLDANHKINSACYQTMSTIFEKS